MAVSLNELAKAIHSLEEALALYRDQTIAQSDIVRKAFRDACIQRFEYCIELAWKTSMKVLGSTTLAAKPAIREMARNNLIPNPDQWMEFIEARNESSHSYDEEIAAKVFKSIEAFHPESVRLLEALKKQK